MEPRPPCRETAWYDLASVMHPRSYAKANAALGLNQMVIGDRALKVGYYTRPLFGST